MITMTVSRLGLFCVGIVIIVGLSGPIADSEGDNWMGFAYAATNIILAAIAYPMSVGINTLFGLG